MSGMGRPRSSFLGLASLLTCFASASAQGLVGSNLPITTASGFQGAPAIAADPGTGEFLVVWQDLRSGSTAVFGQRVDNTGTLLGGDFPVAAGASAPCIAFNSPMSEFLVAYAKSTGIFGRRIAVDGSLIGGEITLFAASGQSDPAIAHDTATHRYLLVWGQSLGGVRSRTLGADGTPLGPVNTLSTGQNGAGNAAVAFNAATGQHLVVWDAGGDVFARLVNGDGGTAGPFFALTTATGTQTFPSVTVNGSTHQYFVVWWDNRNFGATFGDIFGQLVSPDGSSFGGNVAVSALAFNEGAPSIAYAPATNRYLAIWAGQPSGSSVNVYGRVFDAGGSPLADAIEISSGGAAQFFTSLAVDPTASLFLGAWPDDRNAAESATDVFGQLVTSEGVSQNQPPHADAGADEVVECASPAGASVTLDGSASTDADSSEGTNDDIVDFEWFEDYGQPSQSLLGTGETVLVTLSLGVHVVTLRVTDGGGETDTDEVVKTIVDTTPPELSVALTPDELWPPNHRLVSVTATISAADACGVAFATLSSLESSEPDDAPGAGDGHTVGDITDVALGSADSIFGLRAERSAAGGGRVYAVTYLAVDPSGNEVVATPHVTVPHDRSGVVEPVELSAAATSEGTVLEWTAPSGTVFYDVVRGDLDRLRDVGAEFDLGPLVCIESVSLDVTTEGHADRVDPEPGRAFFYLVEYVGAGASSYGTESAAKPRRHPGSACGS